MTDYVRVKGQILLHYKKKGEEIREKSVEKYLKDIQKIQSLLGDKGKVDDLSFLYNVNDVRGVIENMRGRKIVNGEKVMASDNTKRNYYQSIVSVMDGIEDYRARAYYKKIVNDYNSQYKIKNEMKSSELMKETEDKLISYDALKEVVVQEQMEVRTINDKMKDEDYEVSHEEMIHIQNYTLLSLYMEYPARNELGTLVWITHAGYERFIKEGNTLAEENNYLVTRSVGAGGSYMILNEYKTAGLYHTRRIDINNNLTGLLNRWRRNLQRYCKQTKNPVITTGNPVFYTRYFDILDELWTEAKMTPNALSKYLSRYFEKKIGKPLSTTAIAKIVNSHDNKEHVDAIKKNSKNRGTSIGTLSSVYTPVLPS